MVKRYANGPRGNLCLFVVFRLLDGLLFSLLFFYHCTHTSKFFLFAWNRFSFFRLQGLSNTYGLAFLFVSKLGLTMLLTERNENFLLVLYLVLTISRFAYCIVGGCSQPYPRTCWLVISFVESQRFSFSMFSHAGAIYRKYPPSVPSPNFSRTG